MRKWFLSRSIRKQIATLAIAPLILVTLLAIVTQPLAPRDYKSTTYAEAIAVKIETIVAQVQASSSPVQIAAILDATSNAGLRVEMVPAAELEAPSQQALADNDVRELVLDELPVSLGPVIRDNTNNGALSDVIVVRAGRNAALAFAPPPAGPDVLISDTQIDRLLMVLVVVLPVLLLSLYASRMITAPLTRFVDTARALKPDDGPERPFEEGGALEMVELARSLNDMRRRIRDMINDRTRMLRAISHDLRTPLTRLRLRAEKSIQPDLRKTMLNDIKRIDEMIGETLTFLSDDVSAEAPVKADLPSLLQTVCADFADVGFAVTYDGPDRFAYPCKHRALARAITNLVDNGTKFGDVVVVRLVVHTTGSIEISVIDDGPGLAEEFHLQVLEPFFKANPARTATKHGGFGLGLSIVSDIVLNHGGSMYLRNGASGGLIVSVDLPSGRDLSQYNAPAQSSVSAQAHQLMLVSNNS